MEATAATAPNAVAKDSRQRSFEIKPEDPAKQALCFAITRLSLSCRVRKLLEMSSGVMHQKICQMYSVAPTGGLLSLGPFVVLVGHNIATCVLWQFVIPPFTSFPESNFVCSMMWFKL